MTTTPWTTWVDLWPGAGKNERICAQAVPGGYLVATVVVTMGYKTTAWKENQAEPEPRVTDAATRALVFVPDKDTAGLPSWVTLMVGASQAASASAPCPTPRPGKVSGPAA